MDNKKNKTYADLSISREITTDFIETLGFKAEDVSRVVMEPDKITVTGVIKDGRALKLYQGRIPLHETVIKLY